MVIDVTQKIIESLEINANLIPINRIAQLWDMSTGAVRTYLARGSIDGVKILGRAFIDKDTKCPRKYKKENKNEFNNTRAL